MIRVDKGTSVEELLEALRIMELLTPTAESREKRELLGSAKERTAGEASQREQSPQELLVQRLQRTRFRRKPKKVHWKTKLSKRRAKGRKDNQIIRTRRKAQWAERLQGVLTPAELAGLSPTEAEKLREHKLSEAWYDWLARKSNTGWAKRKGWEISFEDFEKYVWPKLKGRVPVTYRINTQRNWSLDNVRWYDSETRELLADGSELYLLKKGYTKTENPASEITENGAVMLEDGNPCTM